MRYIKAEAILPQELIAQIQIYADGVNIYIPRKAENRRSWGYRTTYKQELSLRNKNILRQYQEGTAIVSLAEQYHLSEKSIRRIIIAKEKEHANMQIIHYFQQEDPSVYLAHLQNVDWSAAKFLVSLLEENRFHEMLGGWGDILMLMDGEKMVSFATFTGQDSVRDESMTPWIGFVWTEPAYRGHRHAGKILAHAEQLAALKGYAKIHIATDYVGLYEKYGYIFQENRIDFWGEEQRVLYKTL